MTNRTDIKYEFETKDRVTYFLFPAIFLPLYYDMDINIIFKFLIYITPAWLLNTFAYSNMVILNDRIVYTQYSKPFAKTYHISFSDIEKVYVSRIEMSNNSPVLVITSKLLNKKFKVQIYKEIDEHLCEYFVDHKIQVETNNSELRNHISHYVLGHKKRKP